jgi:hypothetical protein
LVGGGDRLEPRKERRRGLDADDRDLLPMAHCGSKDGAEEKGALSVGNAVNRLCVTNHYMRITALA